MSAECSTCGTDLTYDGDCVPCDLRKDVARLTAERDALLALRDAAEPLVEILGEIAWLQAVETIAESHIEPLRTALSNLPTEEPTA